MELVAVAREKVAVARGLYADDRGVAGELGEWLRS